MPLPYAGEQLRGSGGLLRWLNQDGDGGDFSDEEIGPTPPPGEKGIITQNGFLIATQAGEFLATQN